MNSVNCFCKILDVLQGSEYMSAESVTKFKADNGNNSKNMLTSKKDKQSLYNRNWQFLNQFFSFIRLLQQNVIIQSLVLTHDICR